MVFSRCPLASICLEKQICIEANRVSGPGYFIE